MVGALARLNLNYDHLLPNAKKIAEALELRPVNCNPFMNNIAQLVEVVHCMEDSTMLIDDLLKNGIKDEKPLVSIRDGKGTGAVEVPRGILFHEYEYNKNGECVWANCIIEPFFRLGARRWVRGSIHVEYKSGPLRARQGRAPTGTRLALQYMGAVSVPN